MVANLTTFNSIYCFNLQLFSGHILKHVAKSMLFIDVFYRRCNMVFILIFLIQ